LAGFKLLALKGAIEWQFNRKISSFKFQISNSSLLMKKLPLLVFLGATFIAARIDAQTVFYNNDFPNALVGTASRPESTNKIEIESADDFIANTGAHVTGATFSGLLPSNFDPKSIGQVRIEIYHVFPLDSDPNRTPNVTTRLNSPSDVALLDRDSTSGGLTFTLNLLNANFTAANSVLDGINPAPNQLTHGEGAITGDEVRFTINFTNPFDLAPGHYFFVPQVELAGTDNFFWLSSTRPLAAPSTIFAPDLQSWIRNARLDPDWSRVGADIIGGTTFNAAFSLTGIVPDSGSTLLLLAGATGVLVYLKRRFRPI
jgi:hypothetical protein